MSGEAEKILSRCRATTSYIVLSPEEQALLASYNKVAKAPKVYFRVYFTGFMKGCVLHLKAR